MLLVIQLVQPRTSDPPNKRSRSLTADPEVPASVKSIMERSCYACHSNETKWPWYSRIAPVSWIIDRDVHAARQQLNLSEWISSPGAGEDNSDAIESICEALTGRSMPPKTFLLLHPEARPSKSEVSAVCSWADKSTTSRAEP
jgi:hypothetical protein